jgi:hypothetical protein
LFFVNHPWCTYTDPLKLSVLEYFVIMSLWQMSVTLSQMGQSAWKVSLLGVEISGRYLGKLYVIA